MRDLEQLIRLLSLIIIIIVCMMARGTIYIYDSKLLVLTSSLLFALLTHGGLYIWRGNSFPFFLYQKLNRFWLGIIESFYQLQKIGWFPKFEKCGSKIWILKYKMAANWSILELMTSPFDSESMKYCSSKVLLEAKLPDQMSNWPRWGWSWGVKIA